MDVRVFFLPVSLRKQLFFFHKTFRKGLFFKNSHHNICLEADFLATKHCRKMEKKAMNSDNVCTQKGQTRTHIEYKISFSTWSFPHFPWRNIPMLKWQKCYGIWVLIEPT